MKKYEVLVTESYSTTYIVEAESLAEAREKADNMAIDDTNITRPENLDRRTTEVLSEKC